MTVRAHLFAALALVALLLSAGCGGERTNTVVETDDPLYQQAKKLQRLERNPEALVAFLKVIEQRGDQSAPESHLEAGLIYLRYIKDPIEAIHHFRKYLELQSNPKQAAQVRTLIDTARREFARTLPGRPMESEPVGGDQAQRIKDLEREIEDLRSENAGLRALAPAPTTRTTRATIELAEPAPAAPVITPAANAPIRINIAEPDRQPVASAPPKVAFPVSPPTAKQNAKQAPAKPAAATRRHTVAPKETLYAISKKYGVTVEAIVAANRDVLPSVNAPLRMGTELKIP